MIDLSSFSIQCTSNSYIHEFVISLIIIYFCNSRNTVYGRINLGVTRKILVQTKVFRRVGYLFVLFLQNLLKVYEHSSLNSTVNLNTFKLICFSLFRGDLIWKQ